MLAQKYGLQIRADAPPPKLDGCRCSDQVHVNMMCFVTPPVKSEIRQLLDAVGCPNYEAGTTERIKQSLILLKKFQDDEPLVQEAGAILQKLGF